MQLEVHELVHGRPLLREAVVEPPQRRYHCGILLAEPLRKLNRERACERDTLEAPKSGGGRELSASRRTEQTVRERVGLFAGGSRPNDPVREAPQVFDQDDTERDRDCPELPDRQRRDPLVRADEAAEHLRIEAAIGVGHERPRDSENARESLQMSFGELRQLSVEARRQVVVDLANLLLDDVKVVDEPFGGRRDRSFFADRVGDGPVRLEEDAGVFVDPWRDPPTASAAGGDPLRHGKAFRVLLETLDTEELCSDGFFAVGEHTHRRRTTGHGSPECARGTSHLNRCCVYGRTSRAV